MPWPGNRRILPISISAGDSRWTEYLNRIGSELAVTLSEATHTSRVSVPLAAGHHADIVVATFSVAKTVAAPIARV